MYKIKKSVSVIIQKDVVMSLIDGGACEQKQNNHL